MRKFLWIVTLSLAYTASLCWSAGESLELFQKGLAAYQNKQYAEAREAFQKLLDSGMETPALLNNLALTALQQDQKPYALALWRKALFVQPGFKPAQRGRDLLENKMQLRPFERDSFSRWSHRSLGNVSLFELLWVKAIVLTLAGWLGLRYWGERSVALEANTPLPPFPTQALISCMLLIITLTLVTMKIIDEWSTRATVTGTRVNARSLPAEDSVGLFELNGGSEVLVWRNQDGWAQVQNAEGASGWVKDNDIFRTSQR